MCLGNALGESWQPPADAWLYFLGLFPNTIVIDCLKFLPKKWLGRLILFWKDEVAGCMYTSLLFSLQVGNLKNQQFEYKLGFYTRRISWVPLVFLLLFSDHLDCVLASYVPCTLMYFIYFVIYKNWKSRFLICVQNYKGDLRSYNNHLNFVIFWIRMPSDI